MWTFGYVDPGAHAWTGPSNLDGDYTARHHNVEYSRWGARLVCGKKLCSFLSYESMNKSAEKSCILLTEWKFNSQLKALKWMRREKIFKVKPSIRRSTECYVPPWFMIQGIFKYKCTWNLNKIIPCMSLVDTMNPRWGLSGELMN